MAVADAMCRNLGFGLEFFRNWFFAWFLMYYTLSETSVCKVP